MNGSKQFGGCDGVYCLFSFSDRDWRRNLHREITRGTFLLVERLVQNRPSKDDWEFPPSFAAAHGV